MIAVAANFTVYAESVIALHLAYTGFHFRPEQIVTEAVIVATFFHQYHNGMESWPLSPRCNSRYKSNGLFE